MILDGMGTLLDICQNCQLTLDLTKNIADLPHAADHPGKLIFSDPEFLHEEFEFSTFSYITFWLGYLSNLKAFLVIGQTKCMQLVIYVGSIAS